MEVLVSLPEGEQVSESDVSECRKWFERNEPEFYRYIASGDVVEPDGDRSGLVDLGGEQRLEISGEDLDWFSSLADAFGMKVGEAVGVMVFAESRSGLAGLLARV